MSPSAPATLAENCLRNSHQTSSGGTPKSLASPEVRAFRESLLRQSHINQLTSFVHRLRDASGPGFRIPYFDPLDGGMDAEVLFLLEAPGPKAVASGFVSRDNPDESAKNFFLMNAAAGIERKRTVIWNVVPWYVGSGRKIRPATAADVRQADEWLLALLSLLSHLRFVVLVGQKARYAKHQIEVSRPDVELLEIPHPSPMFVNRAPGNRERLQAALLDLSSRL